MWRSIYVFYPPVTDHEPSLDISGINTENQGLRINLAACARLVGIRLHSELGSFSQQCSTLLSRICSLDLHETRLSPSAVSANDLAQELMYLEKWRRPEELKRF
jgi:hypothetical protein